MLESTIGNMSIDRQIAARTLRDYYKERLKSGSIHRIAFELAQIEIDIEIENEKL